MLRTMIPRGEIDSKAVEFDIHSTNVQRDYVFGWLLFAIYNNRYFSNMLILKGGNCFRKAYFPDTRFSADLDFSTEQALDIERIASEIDACCLVAQNASGIQFVTDRNRFHEARRAHQDKNTKQKIYKGKVFFRDFYGEQSYLEISVRMDVTEFDRLYLAPSNVLLIHLYSDADDCSVNLQCIALEEAIASKLKCLLQRRYVHDLYDLGHAVFFNQQIELDRSEIARVFLRKTIFGDSPGSAQQILLGLPMSFFKAAWEKYIVCPVRSRLDFDRAEEVYRTFINNIFGATGRASSVSDAFFPAELRNLFLEAGSGTRLMEISYDGMARIVEPYALTYKRRADGQAREYLYVWDRSGGSSGKPGIRSLVNPKVENPRILEDGFEPRFEIELSKAGETTGKGYFGGGRRRGGSRLRGRTSRPSAAYSGGPQHVVECPFCAKRFKRKSSDTKLNPHKDKHGYPCMGRSGFSVGWEY